LSVSGYYHGLETGTQLFLDSSCVPVSAPLFNRLPKTRAATGDDALRQVLARARQQPPPETETPEPSPE
jgi:hypothetical protein